MSYRLASFFVSIPLMFAVACGDSGGGDGVPPGVLTLTMSGTVNVTGDVMVSGNFVTVGYSLQPSCAAYAAEGHSAEDLAEEGSFEIAGPTIGVPLEPTRDIYASTLRIPAIEYAGPGVYVNMDDNDQILGQIMLLAVPGGPTYYLEDGPTTATVMADASGTLTFDDIPETGPGNTVVSGTVSWTCIDPE
jgi:hypothetical protein